MLTVFLYGPSGVGKSTLAKAYAAEHNCCIIDTDEAYADGFGSWSANGHPTLESTTYFERVKGAVDTALSACNKAYSIVVVGAGALQYTAGAARWLATHPTIVLMDEPDRILQRLGGRPSGGYVQREFSTHRQQLYDQASYRIDVAGRTAEQLVPELQGIFLRLL